MLVFGSFTGYDCGFSNLGGFANSFYGKEAGFHNTNGVDNCEYGNHAGDLNMLGDSNVYMGYYCGAQALGNENVFIGLRSGWQDASGQLNVFIGSRSGYTAPGGNYNTVVGAEADVFGNNSGAIGASAFANNNNQMQLGNNNVSTTLGMSTIVMSPNVTRLEINTQYGLTPFTVPTGGTPPAYVNGGAGTGWSGLRFDDLTATDIPGPNPGPGVLSVDRNGNVIYVPASTGSGIGAGNCPALTPLAVTPGAGYSFNPGTNFYFAGNGSGSLNDESVLIGKNCVNPLAKLDVLQASNAPFIAAQSSIGIYVENDDLQLSTGYTVGSPVIGIKSYVPNPNNHCQAVAGWFEAPGVSPICAGNYAIIVPPNGGASGFGTTSPDATVNVVGSLHNLGYTEVDQNSSSTAFESNALSTLFGSNVAVYGNAQNAATQNIGVSCNAAGPAGSVNYGLYATYTGGAGSYAGYFNGAAFSTTAFTVSDSNLKENIENLSNANCMSILSKLTPRTYTFKQASYPSMNLPTGTHYGLLSQEVEKVLPNLVRNSVQPAKLDSAGNIINPAVSFKALNYTELIPLLLKGIQVQQAEIDSLKVLVQQNGSKNSIGQSNNDYGGSTTNEQTVTLSNSVILYQNTPNPFGSNGTKISYFLPEGTMGASIVFYDMYGSQLKAVQLTQTGMGTINVNADNLSNGVYSYSLLINNQVVDTKKMVFAK